MTDTLTMIGRRSALLGAGIAAVPLLGTQRGLAQGADTAITVDRARTAPIPIAIPALAGTALGAQM
ncbi:MAG: hypothetical protein ACRYG8_04805, partial [Janthinobacterium lividum]